MTEMKSTPEKASDSAGTAEKDAPAASEHKETKENIFSNENLTKDEKVEGSAVDGSPEVNLGRIGAGITITADDKIRFIDSIVQNSRFTKDYSLFGGRITLTLRSLTSDEVNALATWTVRQGTKDSAGLLSGRYRKYLMAANVARFNGVDMPPLEAPLFERLGSDGKSTEPPGWVDRSKFYDDMEFGCFQAILKCIADFDVRYSTLCSKAEDANFWNPDTP